MRKFVLTALLVCASLALPAQTLSNYQAGIIAQNPMVYFSFDGGSLSSVFGKTVTLTATPVGTVAGQFSFDVFGNAGNSIYFTGANDAIYDPAESSDLLVSGGGTATTNSTATGSISLLFRSLDPGIQSTTGEHFVFDAGGAAGTSNSLALLFENTANSDPLSLKLRFGDSSTVILPTNNIVADSWYYFALTYHETAVTNKATWYLGRLGGGSPLLSGTTSNALNAVAGDAAEFIIGSHTNFTSSFRNPGNGQVDELATWNRELSAAEIQAQYAKLPNTVLPVRSTYQSTITGQSPFLYFKLDGSLADSVHGTFSLTGNGNAPQYSGDYFGTTLSACYFNGGTDALLANSNLLSGGGTFNGNPGPGQGAVSCIFHSLTSTNVQGQRFVFSTDGAAGTSNAFGLFFENATGSNPLSLKLRFGDSSSVILPASNFMSAWYYFAMNYDETRTNQQVHWWLGIPGGILQSGSFSATAGSLAGQGNQFLIGNFTNFNAALRNSTPGSNGQVDEFAIWHRLLATNEVLAQFSALTLPAPSLSISLSGTNAIISWPSSNGAGFNLQSSPTLVSPAWSGAGAAAQVGNQFVVTNGVAPGSLFYRLKK